MNIGTSYRPISLLSVIAETLENTLLPYITNNIPHISTQHGFKSNHSTTQHKQHHHNRLQPKQTTRRTITVALDMSKAFDTVNIHTLTHKLHQTNIPHTIIKYIAKHTPHSETKHQHNANSKIVFHKAVCYHPHSSTYAHLTLQHHRHQ